MKAVGPRPRHYGNEACACSRQRESAMLYSLARYYILEHIPPFKVLALMNQRRAARLTREARKFMGIE